LFDKIIAAHIDQIGDGKRPHKHVEQNGNAKRSRIGKLDNGQQLRKLIEDAKITQRQALDLFNANQLRPISLGHWKAFMAGPGSARRSPCPDQVLLHARDVLVRDVLAGRATSRTGCSDNVESPSTAAEMVTLISGLDRLLHEEAIALLHPIVDGRIVGKLLDLLLTNNRIQELLYAYTTLIVAGNSEPTRALLPGKPPHTG